MRPEQRIFCRRHRVQLLKVISGGPNRRARTIPPTHSEHAFSHGRVLWCRPCDGRCPARHEPVCVVGSAVKAPAWPPRTASRELVRDGTRAPGEVGGHQGKMLSAAPSPSPWKEGRSSRRLSADPGTTGDVSLALSSSSSSPSMPVRQSVHAGQRRLSAARQTRPNGCKPTVVW